MVLCPLLYCWSSQRSKHYKEVMNKSDLKVQKSGCLTFFDLRNWLWSMHFLKTFEELNKKLLISKLGPYISSLKDAECLKFSFEISSSNILRNGIVKKSTRLDNLLKSFSATKLKVRIIPIWRGVATFLAKFPLSKSTVVLMRPLPKLLRKTLFQPNCSIKP